MSNKHETINYLEFPAENMAAIKQFYSHVFAWVFTDYGDDYIAFSSETMEGGFYRSSMKSSTETGSALVVFYSSKLEATLEKVIQAGGQVVKATFEFPGGRRFHFTDPHGNEFAVWSEQ